MADKDRDAAHAVFGLSDSETRRAAPADAPPGSPQYVYVQGPPPSASGGSASSYALWVLVVLLVIASGVNLYLGLSARQQFSEALSKQSDQLNLLTRRLDSGDQRYAELKSQFQVKLGLTQQELSRARALAANIQNEQQEAVKQLNQAIASKASAEEVNKVQADANAKIGNVSSELAGTRKELEDALAGTKGELSGAIARTHDELVALAHKSDRDYFEFNLGKKGARQKIGTVMIELMRTNLKKNQFTVNLVFDDKAHPYKDRTVAEPLPFYVSGASSALELVVNKVGKDSLSGYVSAPKGFFPNTPNVLGARPGM